MKRSDDPKAMGDLPGSLRVALAILEFLTPADFREPFLGDLLEEWQARIVPESGRITRGDGCGGRSSALSSRSLNTGSGS